MKLHKKEEGKVTEFVPGFHGRFIHTGEMTLAYIRIEKGAILPEHAHHHAQITQVISGHLILTIDGVKVDLRPGDVVEIPSNVPHSGVAMTEVEAHDIFKPEREDYRF